MFRYRNCPLRFLFAAATFCCLSLNSIVACADTLTDPLDSFRFTGGSSHGVVLDTTNPNYFFGDSSRAKCDGANVGSFYYHLPGITSFAAFSYYFHNGGTVEVYASTDGQTWSAVPLKASTPRQTTNNPHDGWTSARIEPDGPLPPNTNFVGFTLRTSDNIFTPQIGQVSIEYGVPSAVSKPGPRGLSVTPGDDSALLTWYALPGAESYDVARRSVSSPEFHTVAKAVSATSDIDRDLSNGTKYYYAVTANTKEGRTGTSDEVLGVPNAKSTVFHDPLTDWSQSSSHSADLVLTTTAFGANVAKRQSDSPQNVTYNIPGATAFEVNIYSTESDVSNAIRAEVSADGADWKPAAITFKLPAKIGAHAFASVCASDKPLPTGTNFIKFILGADGVSIDDPQIADVRITHVTTTSGDGGKKAAGGS